MRDKLAITEVINGMCGILISSGASVLTQVGLTIDTLGFKEMLAILSTGAAIGTTGNKLDVYATVYESDSPNGTFAAVNDGAISGTAVTTYLALTAGTGGVQYNTGMASVTRLYERLNDGVRKRYIKFTASAIGSGAVQTVIPYSVNVVLSRAADTGIYISNPVTQSSGNVECSFNSQVVGTAIV